MTALPIPATIVEGPNPVGSELLWRVRRPDGSDAVVGQLRPELARDDAVRRRYRRDVARLAGLEVAGIAEVFQHGPAEDDGTPPWRVRSAPPGEPLAHWIERRAPAPLDEAAQVVARLAQVLAAVHRHGLVVRSLHPQRVIMGPDGSVTLTDVGLSRVEILSTRSAASLILEGSPYASPEQLLRTTVDQRSDVYALGAILWHAVTGEVPFGDTPVLLRDHDALSDPRTLRPEIPDAMAALLRGSLAADPDARPPTATLVAAILRGERHLREDDGSTTCQNCQATLRLGQRICVSCGREAVQFVHASDGSGVSIQLTRVKEDAEYLGSLRSILESVARDDLPPLNFIIGDQRMYSKREREALLHLPLVLFDQVEPNSARRLVTRLQANGISTRTLTRSSAGVGRIGTRTFGIGGAVAIAATAVAVAAGAPVWVALAAVIPALMVVGLTVTFAVHTVADRKRKQPGLLRLREAPAALPASDPLVARLGALVDGRTPPDIRARVGELALQIQRLVDHRAGLGDASRAEADLTRDLLDPLVEGLADEIRRLRTLDEHLASLDEGTLMRAISAAEARGEPTAKRLDDLDRLRQLEDARTDSLHRLLEAGSLLQRAIDLGLSVQDDEQAHERQIQRALAALTAGE